VSGCNHYPYWPKFNVLTFMICEGLNEFVRYMMHDKLVFTVSPSMFVVHSGSMECIVYPQVVIFTGMEKQYCYVPRNLIFNSGYQRCIVQIPTASQNNPQN
jgi:hypothetical protein